jgi:hypothetical protein
MKKIVFLMMLIGCLPLSLMAQNEDDLYYIPSKNGTTTKTTTTSKSNTTTVRTNKPTTVVVTTPQNNTGRTVVVRRGNNRNNRNVDEYNRRYSSSDDNSYPERNDNTYDNGNAVNGDTLYIDENNDSQNRNVRRSSAYDDDLDGTWVNGFDGTDDDYEYATRIIRFRNPRFAVSISSPYYWDLVYGMNSWDWNIYYDGMYAYAFPTFSNRLWWDWRFNSYGWGFGWDYGYGYGGWYNPYYASYWGWGDPYYGGWYGGGWYGGWGRGWDGGNYAYRGGYYSPRGWDDGHHLAGVTYRNNRYSNYGNNNGSYTRGGNYGNSGSRGNVYGNGASSRRFIDESQNGNPVQSAMNARRVIGTRSDASSASSSRRESYDRPSSTRVYGGNNGGYSSRRVDSGYSNNGVYTRSYNPSSNNNGGFSNRRSYTPSYNTGNSSAPSRSFGGYSNSSRSSSFGGGSYSGGGRSGGFSGGGGSSRGGGFSGGGSTGGGGGGHSSRR